jgi:transposase-like protein
MAASYFEGLRHLAGVFIYRRRAKHLREAAARHFGLDILLPDFPVEMMSFESLNITQRRALILLIRKFMESWPDGFIEFCKANELWSAALFRGAQFLPFWYWSVVNENLNLASYRMPDQEFASIVNHIESKGGVADKNELSKYIPRGVYQKRMKETGLVRRGKNKSKCPRCGATKRQIKSRRTRLGAQCYQCRLCDRYYTPEPVPRGHPESLRCKAARLYERYGSYTRVARELSVSVEFVRDWVKFYSKNTN